MPWDSDNNNNGQGMPKTVGESPQQLGLTPLTHSQKKPEKIPLSFTKSSTSKTKAIKLDFTGSGPTNSLKITRRQASDPPPQSDFHTVFDNYIPIDPTIKARRSASSEYTAVANNPQVTEKPVTHQQPSYQEAPVSQEASSDVAPEPEGYVTPAKRNESMSFEDLQAALEAELLPLTNAKAPETPPAAFIPPPKPSKVSGFSNQAPQFQSKYVAKTVITPPVAPAALEEEKQNVEACEPLQPFDNSKETSAKDDIVLPSQKHQAEDSMPLDEDEETPGLINTYWGHILPIFRNNPDNKEDKVNYPTSDEERLQRALERQERQAQWEADWQEWYSKDPLWRRHRAFLLFLVLLVVAAFAFYINRGYFFAYFAAQYEPPLCAGQNYDMTSGLTDKFVPLRPGIPVPTGYVIKSGKSQNNILIARDGGFVRLDKESMVKLLYIGKGKEDESNQVGLRLLKGRVFIHSSHASRIRIDSSIVRLEPNADLDTDYEFRLIKPEKAKPYVLLNVIRGKVTVNPTVGFWDTREVTEGRSLKSYSGNLGLPLPFSALDDWSKNCSNLNSEIVKARTIEAVKNLENLENLENTAQEDLNADKDKLESDKNSSKKADKSAIDKSKVKPKQKTKNKDNKDNKQSKAKPKGSNPQ